MTRLNACERDIQTVMHEAIKVVDFSVVFGHRTPEEQFELFKKGRKEVNKKWIVDKVEDVVTFRDGYEKKSNHNYEPSRAIDIIPYPSGWKSEKEFYYVAGVVMAVANRLLREGRIEKPIKWGGFWENFVDMPHFEI